MTYDGSLWGATAAVLVGLATANGRKAKEPVSDSMSPANGADKEGPTAVLLSASKIDQSHIMAGNVLNLNLQKLHLAKVNLYKNLLI